MQILATEHFPEAKQLSVIGLTDVAQMFTSVADGKADAIVTEPVYAGIYMMSNPGKVRKVSMPPLRVTPATSIVGMDSPDLLDFLNTSLTYLIEIGFVDKVVAKHVENSEDLTPVAHGYAVPD